MSILTPTVHERLARCGTSVFVNGLVIGADVELDIDGNILGFAATGSSRNIAVPPLTALAIVKCRQNDGTGWTPWSPDVIVEDVSLPPAASPLLPAEVGSCSQCVLVRSAVPGSKIELWQGNEMVGSGTADRNGNRCVGVKLFRDAPLRARMVVCGNNSPETTCPIVEDHALSQSVVGSPLYGCQRVIPLSDVHRGARVRLESNLAGDLGNICSCWNAVNVWIGANLTPGDQVRAQAYWDDTDRCKLDGPWSAWRQVIAPDEGIKPVVEEALIEDDLLIRVTNQIGGAELIIYIATSDSANDLNNPQQYGPRAASDIAEISLNAPLAAGNIVWVDQTLCGHTERSDAIEVRRKPPEVLAPTIIEPLYDCGYKVTVIGLHAGATVRIYQEGFPIGLGWSGLSNSLTISVAPGLVLNSRITARQWVGGQAGPFSNEVVVQSVRSLHTPRILNPVTINDHAVWVSGVTPGAKVAIYSNNVLIGETEAAEPLVKVSTSKISGPVTAKLTFCVDMEVSSEAVNPVKSPCSRGDWQTGSRFESFGSFTLSDWDDGGCVDGECLSVPIRGQLYYPSHPGGCLSPPDYRQIHPDARKLPLVIIAHGYWLDVNDSYLGYDYLAHHLASWGMIVYSIDLQIINEQHFSISEPPFQSARGEVILNAIESVINDSDIRDHLNPDSIGLIGHSMGGEAVTVAQVINLSRPNPFAIKGVVSIAPTQYREDISLKQAEYLQLLGSQDYLISSHVLSDDANAIFNGFRIFDRAERNKSHVWIYGATHNPFNTKWILGDEDNFPVSAAEHRVLAKCMINAFFQKSLFSRDIYEGYLEGLIFPPAVRHLDIFMQHLKANREIVDNFGDADPQAGEPLEGLSKQINRMGGIVTSDAQMVTWADVESLGSGDCVHNTKCVELAWDQPLSLYSSEAGLNLSAVNKKLSFRICQYYEDGLLNEADREIDLLLQVSEGSSDADNVEVAVVRMGIIGTAPYPDESMVPYAVFRSIRVPVDVFSAVNPDLNPNSIKSITLKMLSRPTGHILVDDIELDK